MLLVNINKKKEEVRKSCGIQFDSQVEGTFYR
jgi:hypothetical protein